MEWNIYEEKFIHNKAQELACMVILGIVDIDYCPLETKELLFDLSKDDKEYIKKRCKQL